MENLRGMNAVVTGASRGLGVYIAKALAAEGVNVALAARTAEKLEETRRLCEAQGVRAVAVACDVTSRDDLQRLVQTAEQALGDIDIVVNNAGIEVAASIVDHSFEQLDELIRTNLNAPIWLTRLMLPGMMARGRGAVVNIASLAGKSPVPYGSVYAATKAALIGFTGSIEIELDATGVHAGVVCPSFVSEAGMWADYGQKAPWMAREVPPQKVAEAVLKAIRGAPEVLVSAGPIRRGS